MLAEERGEAFSAVCSWRWRRRISSCRALVRDDSCRCFFLIPCCRFPNNDQSKYAPAEGSVPWYLSVEGCRPTFWLSRFPRREAILIGRQRGRRWAYTAGTLEHGGSGRMDEECIGASGPRVLSGVFLIRTYSF